MATIYTIGFTKKSLEQFIGLLRGAEVARIADIRLRNTSQLAGWSKYPDFAYLLHDGFGIEYEHRPEFAPTADLLDRYKRDRNWDRFELDFKRLLADRNPVSEARALMERAAFCLLCTEPAAKRCHRRLVADFLAALTPGALIEHL
jgi:uncharacterized protein (DUF488 family)